MIELNDANSYTCAVHTELKCRIYPRVQSELQKHYEAAARRAGTMMCLHGYSEPDRCRSCMAAGKQKRRGWKKRDPTAIGHKAGIHMGTGKRKHE